MLSTATQYTRDAAEVGNIGHFDNEMDMAGLENFPGIKIDNIKPQAPPAVCSAILREARSSSQQFSNMFKRWATTLPDSRDINPASSWYCALACVF